MMDQNIQQARRTPPPPKKQSGMFIGILLFLLGILVGLALGKTSIISGLRLPYLGAVPTPTSIPTPTPTPNPTANWKTYTNTKIGFELKYPPRYPQPGLPSGGPDSPPIYVTGNEDNTDIIFGQSSKDSVDLIVFPFSGTIDALKNYTKSPIILPLYENSTLIKSILIGETTAQWYKATPKITYPDDPNAGAIRVYFVGKNHGFILNTTLNHSEEEITQILSTFKFTDQASDTANWKTYRGKHNTFSFKYPDDINWKINETQSGVSVYCESCTSGINIFGAGKILINSLSDFQTKSADLGYSDLTNTTLSDLRAISFLQKGSTQSPTCVGIFTIYQSNNYVVTQCFLGNLTNTTKISDLPKANPDILSTFKVTQ